MTDRPTPTAPLHFADSIGFQVRDLNRAIQRALHGLLAPHGVAPGGWYFLRVLWEEEGLTQREIANRVGMMEPTAVIALRGLERAGWIERRRNPKDRRKIHIRLTPSGRALREELLPLAHEVNARATAGLDAADRDALLGLLRRMRANFSD